MPSLKQDEPQSYYYRPSADKLKSLPASLRESPQWICWQERPAPNKQKPGKVPVNPVTFAGIDPHDPENWMTFEAALAAYESTAKLTGIGFDFAPENDFAGVDIDNCRNPETGQIEPWGWELARRHDSYTEVSPSGAGIKIFLRADLAGRACHFEVAGREIEVYSARRYFTVTGEHVEGTSWAVNDRQKILESLLPAEPELPAWTPPANRSNDPASEAVDAMTDDALLEEIAASRQGAKFQRLMDGDISGYPGYFAATGALCTILAAWTRLNPERIDRIARSSGLIAGWEEWWEESRRGERTIAKACALAASRPQYDPTELILNPNDPMPSARTFVARLYMSGGLPTLKHQEGVFYAWQPDTNVYAEMTTAQVKGELYPFLEKAKHWIMTGKGPRKVDFEPTKAKVENVTDALRAVAILPNVSIPCWLEELPKAPEPTDMLACKNGLLYIPTRKLIPGTPVFFALNGAALDFNPTASTPEKWLAFLRELWGEDDESISTLQELFGYCLSAQTKQQKIAMLVGPRRGGKGTIGRVLRALCGERNYCAPTLSSLGQQFGLAVLIGKSVAVISDARVSGRTDTAMLTERLLSISGEDTISVPRKFLSDWTGKLSTRFILLTNEVPRVVDASGALASRFLVLTLKKSFLGKENPELFESFLPELPGILNWALAGLDRLNERKRFKQPKSSDQLIERLADLSSPVSAFIRDEGYDKSPRARIICADLFSHWRTWCSTNGITETGTIQSFSRDLHAIMPWVEVRQPFDKTIKKQIRTWYGVGVLPPKSGDTLVLQDESDEAREPGDESAETPGPGDEEETPF